MTVSQTQSSAAERRLAVARRLYSALVTQQPDRVFTLRDGQGRLLASNVPTVIRMLTTARQTAA